MEIEHPDFERKPAAATIGMLAERFPATFATDLAKVRPLALGIYHVLVLWCPDIPPSHLKLALSAYCGHGTYLRSMVEGAPRIDLDGAPSGAVTRDAAQDAAERLAAKEAAALAAAAQARAAAKMANHIGFPDNPIPMPSPPPAGQRRLGLADLRAAALARRTGGGR